MNEKVELDAALKKLRDMELAMNESSIVAITNKQGVIQFVNDKFCEISKYRREELVGSKQNIVNSGYHSRAFFKEMWRTIGTGHVWKGEIKNQAKDGSYYWVDTTIVPFLQDNGKPYQYISIRHEITKLKEYEKTIEHMAFYDHLTNLPNRNALEKWLDEETIIDKALTVLFVDVDRFKSINDTFGHHIGDVFLKEVGSRLQQCLAPDDFMIRHGGDELVIVLNDVCEQAVVIPVVDQILKQFTYPFTIQGEHIFATASIGISIKRPEQTFNPDQNILEVLIQQADTAMYQAKKQGGNLYCFNTHEQNVKIHRYYLIEGEVKRALTENQFFVVYQPLMDLKQNHIVGVEALLRWDHPKLGVIQPLEFIPILEELGEIKAVGKWVLETTCRQMKAWLNNRMSIERASINVSPIQFRDEQFVSDVAEILTETELAGHYIDLEITESTILPSGEVEETLQQLKTLGVHISIDDFGTGYSSLSYLKDLPIDTLKIDQSFIRNLDVDEEVIVNTIITMGENLKCNIVAEGIETEEQLSYLKSQNCSEGQGFLWSQPVTAREIADIYEKQNISDNV